jgi:hypothetical protein
VEEGRERTNVGGDWAVRVWVGEGKVAGATSAVAEGVDVKELDIKGTLKAAGRGYLTGCELGDHTTKQVPLLLPWLP